MAVDVTIADETLTARKRHQCNHFLQWIEIGERYRRFRGVWDGTAGVFKAHIECEEVSQVIHSNADLNYDEGILLHADVTQENHEWLLVEYPIVATRLGIEPTKPKGTEP